jgi:hypothetical protein
MREYGQLSCIQIVKSKGSVRFFLNHQALEPDETIGHHFLHDDAE